MGRPERGGERRRLHLHPPLDLPVGRWYVRGFEETLMDCVAEEDFYVELLDRMTDLTLALIAPARTSRPTRS